MIRDDLIRDEGWRPTVYDDHLGFATIGYGFLVDDRRGGGMPKEVGDYWLDLLIARQWNELCRDYAWFASCPPGVQRALQNMRYQLGRGGLSGFRRMLAALAAGDFQTAAAEALDSRWARQTPARAGRVSQLIREGK